MDTPILISVIVLTSIAAVEMFCLCLCRGCGAKRPPLTTVLPVFPSDDTLENSLCYMRDCMLKSTFPIERILLIDYGMTDAQKELCGEFCRDFHEASTILPEELEKILSETFAISAEI